MSDQRSVAEIQDEIERTREELAAGVDELVGRLGTGAHRGARVALVAGGVVLAVLAAVWWRRR